MICDNLMDGDDIVRQMRSLYKRDRSIIKHLIFCKDRVKIQLFKSNCTKLYCGQLWCGYKACTFSKIKVA